MCAERASGVSLSVIALDRSAHIHRTSHRYHRPKRSPRRSGPNMSLCGQLNQQKKCSLDSIDVTLLPMLTMKHINQFLLQESPHVAGSRESEDLAAHSNLRGIA